MFLQFNQTIRKSVVFIHFADWKAPPAIFVACKQRIARNITSWNECQASRAKRNLKPKIASILDTLFEVSSIPAAMSHGTRRFHTIRRWRVFTSVATDSAPTPRLQFRFFLMPAARVRVPGGAPFSQLQRRFFLIYAARVMTTVAVMELC